MSNAYGGLQITGGATPVAVQAAAAAFTTGWAAIAASSHGNLSIVPSAAGGSLTLKPGQYLANVNMSVETEDISGTSGDGVGIITAALYLDGVLVSGSKCKIDQQAIDRPQTISINQIVEVAATAAGVLTVQFTTTDTNGNDITVSEARFNAIKLD